MGLNVKIDLVVYNHDQYHYSRVFGGEELIFDNRFEKIITVSIENSRLLPLIYIYRKGQCWHFVQVLLL